MLENCWAGEATMSFCQVCLHGLDCPRCYSWNVLMLHAILVPRTAIAYEKLLCHWTFFHTPTSCPSTPSFFGSQRRFYTCTHVAIMIWCKYRSTTRINSYIFEDSFFLKFCAQKGWLIRNTHSAYKARSEILHLSSLG